MNTNAKAEPNAALDSEGMAETTVLYSGHSSEVVFGPPLGLVGDDETGRKGRVIVKRLLSSASLSDVVRLGNELTILTLIQKKSDNFDGTSSRIRKALGTDGGSGPVRAIRLEHVRGISTKEYVASVNRVSKCGCAGGADDPEQARLAMLERVRIAHGICAALAEVHDCGFVHNNVSTSSFVVDLGGDAATATVKIISFGDAVFGNHLEADDMGERVNDDIPALGRVLRALFCVAAEDDTGDDADRGFGFGDVSRAQPATLPCVPTSIQVLLRNLHDAHNLTDPDMVPDAYFSCRDVELDVAQLADDPDTFLRDDNGRETLFFRGLDGCGDTTPRMYGQEQEAPVLRNVCTRFLSRFQQEAATGIEQDSDQQSLASSIASQSPGFARAKGHTEVVIVSGSEGSGKTHFVRCVVSSWLNDGACNNRDGRLDDSTTIAASNRGYLIEGSFDEQQSSRPYSVIMEALAHFTRQVVQRGPAVKATVAMDIQEAVGRLGGVLLECIPELESIIGPQATPHQDVTWVEAKNRFRLAFRKLFQAISTRNCPLVVLFKNIERADIGSLSLIETLMTGSNTLIVGTVNRGVHVAKGLNDPLSELLAEAEQAHVPLTNISLEGIDRDAITSLLSDVTGTYRRQLTPLGDLLLIKTSGHVLAVMETIRTLASNGALFFDAAAYRWRWDDAKIRESNLPDNVAHIFTAKIKSLPSNTQIVMEVASVFGTKFDRQAMQAVTGDMEKEGSISLERSDVIRRMSSLSEMSLSEALRALEAEGFIVSISSSSFKFAHVAIQQAAYKLLTPVDRDMLHMHIGNVLRKLAEDGKHTNRDIFLICDHLNKGSSQIESKDDRAQLASLNLCAGEKALATSAFEGAAVYLKQGLDLLSKNGLTCSATSLRLHSLHSATELVNRNFDAVNTSVEWVLASSASILEKFPSYISLVKYLVAQGVIDKAISTGFSVLAQLGESMPTSASMPVILLEAVKTKTKLSGKKNSVICALPPMKEPSKLAAMQMLALMISLCYVTQPGMVGPITFRMIRLTLQYGLCSESPFGFGSYAMILSGIMGDTKGGYRFGRLALDLLEQLDAKTWLARVYGLVYYFVAYWQEPASDALDKFLHAFEVAMQVGDHEYAAWQFVNYAGTALQTSQHLEPLQAAMVDSNSVCNDIQQIFPQSILVLWWQCVLNLLGESYNPLILTGIAVPDEKKYLDDATAANNTLGLHTLYFLRMMLAYTFCEFELAQEYGDKGRDVIAKLAPGQLIVVSHVYYDGLVACALAQNLDNVSDRKKLLKIASSAKKKMKKWASISPNNFLHKYSLLRAEYATLKGNKSKATACYEEAIAVAKKSRFLQDEAIANERVATYFATFSEKEKAKEHQANARQLFGEWGAKAKVVHLDENPII